MPLLNVLVQLLPLLPVGEDGAESEQFLSMQNALGFLLSLRPSFQTNPGSLSSFRSKMELAVLEGLVRLSASESRDVELFLVGSLCDLTHLSTSAFSVHRQSFALITSNLCSTTERCVTISSQKPTLSAIFSLIRVEPPSEAEERSPEKGARLIESKLAFSCVRHLSLHQELHHQLLGEDLLRLLPLALNLPIEQNPVVLEIQMHATVLYRNLLAVNMISHHLCSSVSNQVLLSLVEPKTNAKGLVALLHSDSERLRYFDIKFELTDHSLHNV